MTTATTGLGSGIKAALIVMALGLGVFASIATVVAFFGSLWWAFDLMANFRWQIMWAALLAAIVYALATRGIATFIFIVAVIVNAFVLSPLWFGSQPNGTGEDGTKVVAIDLYGGTDDEEGTLRWMFDSGADVLIVSGVSSERLAPIVEDGSPYQVLVAPEFEDRSGIVVLGAASYAASQDITPGFAQQIVTVTVPSGAGTIDLVTAWGEIATNQSKADALSERLEAVEAVVSGTDSPVVVIGSLGATRFASGMRSLMGSTGLRDATEGSGYLSTWPTSDFPVIGGWVGIPLDVVLMSDGVSPFELVTGPDIGSAHLPVSVVVGPSQ